jgi:hypothetical protein
MMNLNPSADLSSTREELPGMADPSVMPTAVDGLKNHVREDHMQINIKNSETRAITAGGDPNLGIPDRRMVSLHISTGATVNECPFWIGIASAGEISPPSLLNHAAMEDLFSEAAVRGISDHDSVMLTDTVSNPARYVFLMPRPTRDFRETSAWIASMVATVRAWSPESAGFYIAPEVMVADESHEILARVLHELIATMPGTTSFHLLVGRHSFNGVLNTALRLKSELEGDELNVFVYH